MNPTAPLARRTAALAALVLAAVPSPAQNRPAGAGPQESPVTEQGDTYVLQFDETGEGAVTLEAFIKICEEATGINFTYGDEVVNELKSKKVRIFGTKRIPKEDFYSFFQIVLFINNFVCTRVGPEPLTVVVVQPITGPAGRASNLRAEAVYVLPEELDDYADQVATPITTVLHLPNVDVRQLGNSLRTLWTDTASQQAIPLANTNSIILQGFASNVVALARLLQIVDREMALDSEVLPSFEVIPLEFAAAEDVADVLEQLLEARGQAIRNNQQIQAAQGATGPIRGQGADTRILTYPRTNSLLVMGLPEDMRNIKELVARLDVDVVEPERTYHIYTTQNVQAEDLVEVLEDFLQEASRVDVTGGAGRPQQAQGGAAPSSRRQNEVVVVADPTTNSVLIAANKTRYEELLDLVRKLDQRQDQVLIETALIELTGSDTLDLGVELGGADLPGSGTGGFGVTQFGLSTLVDSDMDGVLDSRIPNTGLGGITAGILDGSDFNLPLLINAIRERRDTNVLNVPSVLVNNNGTAEVASIDSQPTTTTTLAPSTGATQDSFAGFEDAGITLRISPSISAAGYLRLNIYLEVATFLGAFQGAIPAPKITRTIQTTVNVPDGDTMVIGGLITDNKNDTRRGVPWLSDIPVLGFLFRRDTSDQDRTTLYFFVTPHILSDNDFADLSEISYQRKLQAADRIGTDRIRLIDPDFQGAGPAPTLEGFQVPLYRSPRTGEVTPDEVGLDPVRRRELLEEAERPMDESGPQPIDPPSDDDDE